MGHHIDDQGRFQSDKHPDLAPDKIIISFNDPEARPALAALAEGYQKKDPYLSADVRTRLRTTRQK